MLLFHSMNADSVMGIPCFMQKLSVLTGGRDAKTFNDCFDK